MYKLVLLVFHGSVERDGEDGDLGDGEDGGATLRCESNLAWPDIAPRSEN